MLLRRVVNGLLVVCAFAWLCVSSVALASEYHGQVTFSGLPLPGSTVTVTATQGDKKATAITDDQGLFSFADLADGTWSLAIEMTGFAAVKQDIAVAPNAPIGTFEMKLLSLDQMRAAAKPVKVEAPVVNATSAPTSDTQVSDARPGAPASPAAAKGAPAKTQVATAAGPAAADAPAPAPAQDATSQQANDGFLINGSVNNAATSQFSLSQAFGNTRNGRSLYNGRIDLYLASSSLDAKQYSLSGLPVTKTPYQNFTLGFSYGGPLKIPHLLPAARAPNFYVFYQRLQSGRDNAQATLIPTLAERGGNLSALTGQTIYAPASGLSTACIGAGVTPGAPIAGNIIPGACISSQAKALLSFYPLPNVGVTTGNNYQTVTTTSIRQDVFQGSLNKQFGNKNNVNGRYSLQSNRTGTNNLFGFHDATGTLGMNFNPNWYHRFTQRLSMNTSYNFSWQRTRINTGFANRQNVEGDANITGVDAEQNYWGPPSLGFSTGFAGLSDQTSAYNRNETNGVTVQVDWNKFRHNVAMGGDFRRQQSNILTQANPRGSFSFSGAATSNGVPGLGSDLADFLLGVPDASAISYGNADKYLRQSVYDLFIRDDFRVNPQLSVNAGLRWEYGSPITELKGRLVNLDITPDFTAQTPVVGSSPVGTLTGKHYPASLVHADYSRPEPRIGIAWRPISGSSLLVRSGYDVTNDTSVYQSAAMAMATQAPLSNSLSLNNTSCALTLQNGFPTTCLFITKQSFAIDPNFRVAYVQTWNLSAQRDLPGSLQMIVTYLGNKGTRGVQEYLPNTYAYGGTNPCPACLAGYVYRNSNGNSTREAGTIQLRRRLRSGFTANLSYTFSKSLDDDYSFGGGQGTGINQQVAQDWRNPRAQRGLSTFDQRHLLTVLLQYTTGMGLGGKSLMSGWRGALYKEWTVQTNISAGSGLPQTAIYPQVLPGTATSNVLRPNFIPGVSIHSSTPGVHVNPLAFALPTAGQFGNARRDSIAGPDQFSLNASMARTFRLHDHYSMDARLDATNILNHPVYTSWYTTLPLLQNTTNSTAPNLFGTPLGINAMRSMSVTLRMRF
jgi:hypothetical protein